MLRVTGSLTPAATAPLDAEDERSLVLPLLEPAQSEELRTRLQGTLSELDILFNNLTWSDNI